MITILISKVSSTGSFFCNNSKFRFEFTKLSNPSFSEVLNIENGDDAIKIKAFLEKLSFELLHDDKPSISIKFKK